MTFNLSPECSTVLVLDNRQLASSLIFTCLEVKSVLVEMQDNDYMKDVSEEEVNAMEATTNAVKQQRKQTGTRRRTAPVSFEHRHRAQSIIQSKALDELETEVFETGLYENHDLSTGSSYGVFAAEIFFSKVSLHFFARSLMCTVLT